jgi:hypothetical protein
MRWSSIYVWHWMKAQRAHEDDVKHVVNGRTRTSHMVLITISHEIHFIDLNLSFPPCYIRQNP